MQATNNNIEIERLKLERRKMELEEKQFAYLQTIDEKKLKSDRSTKIWTQFSIFTPIIILLVGFFLNSHSEQFKMEQAHKEEINKQKGMFIEKQLAKLYYPIQLRLHKDNAVFDVWNKNQRSKNNEKLSRRIEETFVLPNHEEIIKIIDSNFDLIKNDSENEEEMSELMNAMKAYERHVAVYKALKDTGDSRKPIQLNERFPKEFFRLIEERISELEDQRKALLR